MAPPRIAYLLACTLKPSNTTIKVYSRTDKESRSSSSVYLKTQCFGAMPMPFSTKSFALPAAATVAVLLESGTAPAPAPPCSGTAGSRPIANGKLAPRDTTKAWLKSASLFRHDSSGKARAREGSRAPPAPLKV